MRSVASIYAVFSHYGGRMSLDMITSVPVKSWRPSRNRLCRTLRAAFEPYGVISEF